MKSLPFRIISHWQQFFDICSVHQNVTSYEVKPPAINHSVSFLPNYIHQPNMSLRLRFKSSLLTRSSLYKVMLSEIDYFLALSVFINLISLALSCFVRDRCQANQHIVTSDILLDIFNREKILFTATTANTSSLLLFHFTRTSSVPRFIRKSISRLQISYLSLSGLLNTYYQIYLFRNIYAKYTFLQYFQVSKRLESLHVK